MSGHPDTNRVYAIVMALLLIVYVSRDSFLLALADSRRLRRLLQWHAFATAAAVLPASIAIRDVPSPDLIDWLRAPPVWIPVVGIHCALAVCAWLLGHSGRSDRAWIIALIPAPINVFALAAGFKFVQPHAASDVTFISSLIVALLWILIVSGMTKWIVSFQAATDDPEFAISLATVTSLAGLIATPLGSIAALWP